MNLEERDLLLNHFNSDVRKIIYNMIDEVVNAQYIQVVKINMDDEGAREKLVYEKCRAEGGAKVAVIFKKLLDNELKYKNES